MIKTVGELKKILENEEDNNEIVVVNYEKGKVFSLDNIVFCKNDPCLFFVIKEFKEKE